MYNEQFSDDLSRSDTTEELCWPANVLADIDRQSQKFLSDEYDRPFLPVRGTSTMFHTNQIQSEHDSMYGFGHRRDLSPNVKSLDDFPSLGSAVAAEYPALSAKSLQTQKWKDVPVAATSPVTFIHKQSVSKKQQKHVKQQQQQQNQQSSKSFNGIASGLLGSEDVNESVVKLVNDVKEDNNISQKTARKANAKESPESCSGLQKLQNSVLIENLPCEADLSVLQDLLQSFGKVIKTNTWLEGQRRVMQVQ